MRWAATAMIAEMAGSAQSRLYEADGMSQSSESILLQKSVLAFVSHARD